MTALTCESRTVSSITPGKIYTCDAPAALVRVSVVGGGSVSAVLCEECQKLWRDGGARIEKEVSQ